MIKGLNHVGISVEDLERSVVFYRDLLGMQVVVRTTFEGEHYERILQLKGAKGSVALLRRENFQVELFEFAEPTPRRAAPTYPVCDHRITHFCLEVSDLDGEYARLKAAGVSFHCPPLQFFGGAKATYGRDPDGNVFELLEMLAPEHGS
jgi:catechol 2,3-dioxygenase-like lactoylglutathione lyase family enzyme